MQKLKKAAAVALMVSGIGIAGGGIASANDGPEVAIDNLQVARCHQTFDTGAVFAPANVATTGDLNQNIGNFCSNVNLGH
ncbi:hypothetical protein [Streptomyces hyaluromycini]|uniref:hypothetical protein n=1 Tax=Streptomyces hyaluromycini TaxID=1377993 RepID=UPI000D1A87E5|nr:hypothetical protein [Streptomyces hyaluromycini]